MGPSVSFSSSEFCPKSLLLFDVLARGCANSVLEGGRHTFPNLISQGVMFLGLRRVHFLFFTC